jgi:hypothetical protein
MQFLNASWANLAEQQFDGILAVAAEMAENEEVHDTENRLHNEKIIDEAVLAEEQRHIKDSGFQLVINKKKAQKIKANQVKSN